MTVKGLQGTIHADIVESVTVLHHTVYIVAGKAVLLSRIMLDDTELIAVITIQAITGGHPDKAITVLEHLRRKTARHLLVGIKQLTHLGK